MLKATNPKGIRRSTKPSSLELSAVIALKYRAFSLRRTISRFNEAKVSSTYCSQFSNTYDAIALDYDGTLVSLLSRTSAPSPSLIKVLGGLLDCGLPIIVISGRGDSLLQLNKSLLGFAQDSLFLAMYNGSKIVKGVKDEIIVDEKPSLKSIFLALKGNRALAKYARKWSLKDYAIQALPKRKSQAYMDAFCERLGFILPQGLMVRNSGFALDVYPASKTKNRCEKAVTRLVGSKLRFLRIADQGHELGNDYELLNSNGGFSVGTLSANPYACFPVLNPSGRRMLGPRGVEYLLTSIFKQIGNP